MELEIVNKHENPLLKRTEVRFRVLHPKEKTPQRQNVRDKIAASVGTPREAVIISYMRSHFGTSTSEGFAKAYASADEAKKMEPQFLLRRHGLAEKKDAAAAGEKKEGAPPPPPPPPKKEAAPAEKKEAPKPAEKKEAPAAKEAPKPAAAEKKDAAKPAPEKKK